MISPLVLRSIATLPLVPSERELEINEGASKEPSLGGRSLKMVDLEGLEKAVESVNLSVL